MIYLLAIRGACFRLADVVLEGVCTFLTLLCSYWDKGVHAGICSAEM